MKKFKVSLLDKKLWTNYAKFASVSSVIVSLVLAFVDFEQCIKYIIGGCYASAYAWIVFLMVLVVTFVFFRFGGAKVYYADGD